MTTIIAAFIGGFIAKLVGFGDIDGFNIKSIGKASL